MKKTLPFIIATFTLLLCNNIGYTQQKNIIVLLADDLGYHSLGCNGNTTLSTPAINELSSQGVNYSQCRSAPVCSPSRYLLLTGKYNFRNYNGWGDMQTTEHTIANMLNDVGYQTAIYGKWQLNGGDHSIRSLGFNQYCIHDPFLPTDESSEETNQSRYKNPVLYSNGAYIDSKLTLGKYGEDIFTDSLKQFITKNKNKPFFALYTMVSPHLPFSPTPDDAAFASWNPDKENSITDSVYYPSMVKYMDKKIGEIVNHIKSLNLQNNTVILFLGDNGSTPRIHEYYDGQIVQGGKNLTTEAGVHVPLIAWSPGYLPANSVNHQLVDFTDILPTLAHLANITPPHTYGSLDGFNFLPDINPPFDSARSIIYNFNDRRERLVKGEYDTLTVWAQTSTYKIYDTVANGSSFRFYNILEDPFEINPLQNSQLTSEEISISDSLKSKLSFYRKQWQPIFATPYLDSISINYARVGSRVFTDGGTVIMERGLVWDTIANPSLEFSNIKIDNRSTESFFDNFSGLDPFKNYFFRSYTKSNNGVAYSPQLIKPPIQLIPPESINTSEIMHNSFTIKWSPVLGANGYQVDVSKQNNFLSQNNRDSVYEHFDTGNTPTPGWIFGSGVSENNENYGNAIYSMSLSDLDASITTKNFGNPVLSLSFWMNAKTNAIGSFLLEGSDGIKWYIIDQFLQNSSPLVRTYDSNVPGWKNNFVQFKFTNKTNGSTLYLDDIKTVFRTSEFIGVYDSLMVNDTMIVVKDLNPNTLYYYRIRSVFNDLLSPSSTNYQVTTNLLAEPENENKLQITLSPNPVQSHTNLQIKHASGEIDLSLFNVQGQLLWHKLLPASTTEYRIDMQGQPAGLYFIIAKDQSHAVYKLLSKYNF